MADSDGDPEFIGQDLQFAFPQTHSRAVAATAISGDQQPRRARIAGGAEFIPPAPDALDGEGRSVVVDAEIDPSGVGGNVVNSVGYGLAEFGDDEVMHPDRLGLTLGPQLLSAILEVADEFLLLGIDRDRRLAGSLEGGPLGIDLISIPSHRGGAGHDPCLALQRGLRQISYCRRHADPPR
jgi:hypothetical protein